MHRTQLYFDEAVFEQVKQRSRSLGISVSAYIREVVKQDLKMEAQKAKKMDLSEFSGMWRDRGISQKALREKAWK